MRFVAAMLLLSGLTLLGCSDVQDLPAASVSAQPVAFNVEGKPVVEIDVPGLHCDNCSATACTILADVPGVIDAKADPITKKASVAVETSDFDAEAARTALEDQFGEATIVDEQAGTEAKAAKDQT